MKVHQLIKILSGLHQNDEVLISDQEAEVGGAIVDKVEVREVIDEDRRSGKRRVAVIFMGEYGSDCYEFINEESTDG